MKKPEPFDFAAFAEAARILDAAEVPTKNRLLWDGEKFVSDNPELAAKANSKQK